MGSREADGLAVPGAKWGSDLAKAGYVLAFAVTPEVPRDVWMHFSWRSRRLPALITFLSALIFTLLLTALFALSDGRLMPDPLQNRLNFLEDYANLFLYSVICPVYVTLCVMLTSTATSYWRKHTNTRARHKENLSLKSIRISLWLVIITLAASLFITNYQYSLMNTEMDVEYWFLDVIGDVRVPNRAGFYYLVLNFGLLFITLVGAMSYLSIAFEAVKKAKKLNIGAVCRDNAIKKVVDSFVPFYTATMLCKLLVLCYIINTIVWRYSPLGEATGDNITASVFLLLLLGFGGTWLPARAVGTRIAELQIACWKSGLRGEDIKLLPDFQKRVRMIADGLALFVSWSFIFVVYPDWDLLDQLPKLLEWLLQVR
ncbi:MAG TPA: hypothetical protein VI168_09650 [Croceibacterium sp.]